MNNVKYFLKTMDDLLGSVIEICSNGVLEYLKSLNFHFMITLTIIFIGMKYITFAWWVKLFRKGSRLIYISTAIIVMLFYILLSTSIDWGDIKAIKIYIGTLLHSIIATLVIYELIVPYLLRIVKKKLTSFANKKTTDTNK